MGGGDGAAAGLLRLPRLRRAACHPGDGRQPRPAGRTPGGHRRRRRGRGTGLGPALAAPQDATGGGGAGGGGAAAARWPAEDGLPRRGEPDGRRVPGLLPRRLRRPRAARGLRWGAAGAVGVPPRDGGGGLAARPLVRPAAPRTGLSAGPGRAAAPAPPTLAGAVAPPAGGGRGPGARPLLADVVGGAVPAGSLPGAACPAARPRRSRSWDGAGRGAVAVAVDAARAGPVSVLVDDLGAGTSPARQPRRPRHPGVGLALGRDAGRSLPALAGGGGGRGLEGGLGVAGGGAGAAGPGLAGRAPRRHRWLVPGAGSTGRAAAAGRPGRRRMGPSGGAERRAGRVGAVGEARRLSWRAGAASVCSRAAPGGSRPG